MTQATHTPAPWDWQDGVLIGDLDGEGGDVSFAEIGNARLIAAAPDLLAALEYVAGKLTAFADAETDDEEMWMADDMARAVRDAIAKANGN